MPPLDNQRHERFAQELAKGKTADEAYKAAGYKENRHNAATLARKQHISTRLAELQERSAIRAEVTIETIGQMLLADRELARSLGQAAAAVSASEKYGKLHGLFIERAENVNINHDVTDEPLTESEWQAEHGTAH